MKDNRTLLFILEESCEKKRKMKLYITFSFISFRLIDYQDSTCYLSFSV